LRGLTVVKRSGRCLPLGWHQLRRSLPLTLRKRPVKPDPLQKISSTTVRDLLRAGESAVRSKAVVETWIEHQRELDDVAYVRFASVYRNFREAKDFADVLGELSGEEEARLATVRK